MSKKKIITSSIITIMAVAGLVGCGSNTPASSSQESNSSETITSSSEAPVQYSVTFEGSNAKAFGIPSKAEAGTQITFTVVASNKYVLDQVSAKAGNAPITLSGNATDGFTFVMPNANVVITSTVVAEEEQYLVSYTGANTQVFGLPEKSLAGKTINFFVKPNDGYSIKSVEIPGVTLNGNVNDGFSFVMPNKNVAVNTVAELAAQGLSITFEGENTYAVGLKASAFAGETVEFRIAAASGYQVDSVKVLNANNTELTLNGSLESGYSFVMPNGAVKVVAKGLGAYFLASTSTEKTDNTFVFKASDSNASKKYYSDFIKAFIADGKLQSGQSVYARAGSDVYALVDRLAIATDVKVFMNDVEIENLAYTFNGQKYNAYKFVMPSSNAELKVTAGVENTFTVKATTENFFTAKVYKVVEEEPIYTSKFHAGETAFVEVRLKPEYEDKYLLNKVTFNYKETSGYNLSETSRSYSVSEASDGLYSYKLSLVTNYASDLTFEFEWKEMIYAGKPFVGEYAYGNWYATTKPYSLQTGLKFDGAGNGTVNMNSVTIVPNSLNEVDQTFTIKNNSGNLTRTVYYSENIIVCPWDAKTFEDMTDICVGLKGVGSLSELTIVYNSTYSMRDGQAAYVRFFRAGTENEIANFLKIDNRLFLNVEVEFTAGGSDVTVGTSFKVKKNGTTVYTHEAA